MAERVLSYKQPQELKTLQSIVKNSATLPLINGQEFILPHKPLILPSEASEAILSLPQDEVDPYEYPYYVSHEGFFVGPRKIGKHAWLVGGMESEIGKIPLNANSILIGNVLIDPGSREGIPYLLENLRACGKELEDIEMVLITHAHLDHIEAINDLQMIGLVAPVIAPEESVEQIEMEDIKKIGGDIYNHEFNSFKIDYAIPDNQEFEVKGYKIRAIKSPGHSRDHMMYEFTDYSGQRTFVVGDVLLGGERKEFGYDEDEWKSTLKMFLHELKDIDVFTTEDNIDDIVTGHHPRVIHKTAQFIKDVNNFGKQHWDLIPSQPGLLVSPWA